MFECRSVDFKTILVTFTCAPSNVLCVAIVTSRSWMGLWRHCWRWQWLGRVHCTGWEWDLCLECPLQFTSYFVLFSSLFNIPCYKRDKEWLTVHCGDQRHLGLCLGYVPALAYGSCRVSDQGTTLRASDLHNARSTILNPFISICLWYHVKHWRLNIIDKPISMTTIVISSPQQKERAQQSVYHFIHLSVTLFWFPHNSR